MMKGRIAVWYVPHFYTPHNDDDDDDYDDDDDDDDEVSHAITGS
jgi:hypothetical protein